MEISCLLGTTCRVPQGNFSFPENPIIHPLLTKPVRSRWLDIGLVLFLRVYTETSTAPRSMNSHERTWPISSHLDRTSLVNNPYVKCGMTPKSIGHIDPYSNSRCWTVFNLQLRPMRVVFSNENLVSIALLGKAVTMKVELYMVL